jgi:hypothetical protein
MACAATSSRMTPMTARSCGAPVAITPDGKRALVVKSGANRVGLLDIEGEGQLRPGRRQE